VTSSEPPAAADPVRPTTAADKAWYRRQFTIRARATQAATVLLILAALLAGATAATALLTAPAAGGSSAAGR
jgi:hypothetical protein